MNALTSDLPHVGFIGRYEVNGASHFLPTSDIEIQRAVPHLVEILRGFNFAPARYVLHCAVQEEASYFLPFELAANQLRLIITNVDSTVYEGARLEAILRRFDVTAVIGLNGDLLKSLTALGHDPARLLADKVVWARPDAYRELSGQTDFRLLRWTTFGPALGIECKFGGGVHIDCLEWQLDESEDGEILLTSRLARCLPVERLRTGVKGQIVRAACQCGNASQRVIS